MAHYAVSEFLIVLAALWGANRLVANARTTAAFGLLLFGAAAAIGVVRFPLDLIEPWADMHRFAGTMGGLLAMMALAHQILRTQTTRPAQNASRVHMALAPLGPGSPLAQPHLRVLSFLLWSLGLLYLAAPHPPQRLAPPSAIAGVPGPMLHTVFVIR